MKRFFALLMVLLCVALPALAEQRVFDEAGVLSADTESALEKMIDAIREKFEFDVVVAMVPHTNGKEIHYFAADFYDYGGFGFHDSHDGILLLISTSSRAYYILNTGRGEKIFTDSAMYAIEDDMLPSLRLSNYNGGAVAFVRGVEKRLTNFTPLRRANAVFPILAIVGLAVALITALGFKRQMKTVRRQSSASRYIRKGSFQLTRAQDLYLYTTTTRTRIETPSSSGRSGGHGGGGGFTGSSGTHHTGHGGHF